MGPPLKHVKTQDYTCVWNAKGTKQKRTDHDKKETLALGLLIESEMNGFFSRLKWMTSAANKWNTPYKLGAFN